VSGVGGLKMKWVCCLKIVKEIGVMGFNRKGNEMK